LPVITAVTTLIQLFTAKVILILILNLIYCLESEVSRHQNVGENRDIKIANRSFENVSQLKYLGTTVTNQNLI
jgi:hypothetical protein